MKATLIPVHKAMICRQAERVARGKDSPFCLCGVGKLVLPSRQRRLEQPLVAHSR
jgi:hypothetical protein